MIRRRAAEARLLRRIDGAAARRLVHVADYLWKDLELEERASPCGDPDLHVRVERWSRLFRDRQ